MRWISRGPINRRWARYIGPYGRIVPVRGVRVKVQNRAPTPSLRSAFMGNWSTESRITTGNKHDYGSDLRSDFSGTSHAEESSGEATTPGNGNEGSGSTRLVGARWIGADGTACCQ